MTPILEVHSVGKKYRIKHLAGGYLSLRERILSALKFERSVVEDFWALKDVSFDVQPGDSIGIIGRNGAGKSTLLKVLSKITRPTCGKIVSRGRIASLLEVGTGFHPELTGKENVYFNGSLLGMKRREIDTKFEEIVEFSGVSKFLDTPLKHYSSGMQLRLAFAVAAFLEPEILIIDEVLAVGDTEFQKKCLGKMEDVNKSGRTILFVSHNLGAVARLCSKAILLNGGALITAGKTNETISLYLKKSGLESAIFQRGSLDKEIYVSEIIPANSEGEPGTEFRHDEEICFEFRICRNIDNKTYRLLVIVQDELKRRVFASETNIESERLSLRVDSNFLTRGRYSLMCIIYIPAISQFDVVDDCCSFSIVDGGSPFAHLESFDYGTVFARTYWENQKNFEKHFKKNH